MPDMETSLSNAAEPEEVTNNLQAMLYLTPNHLTSRKNSPCYDIQMSAESPSCNQRAQILISMSQKPWEAAG